MSQLATRLATQRTSATRGRGGWLRPPVRHGRPVTVNLTLPVSALLGHTDTPAEFDTGQAYIPAGHVRDLIPDSLIRRLLHDPLTGSLVEISPGYRIPARIADAVATRDHTPMVPTGSTASPHAGDIDHINPYHDGGPTTATNLTAFTRRWHNVKTRGQHTPHGWHTHRNPDGTLTWTSPHGRRYTVHPYDYRDGP
jgi:hypothetical protein